MFSRTHFRSLTLHECGLLDDLMNRCYIGDWFILHLLTKNTSSYMFRRIVKSIGDNIRDHRVTTKTATISLDNIEVKNGV